MKESSLTNKEKSMYGISLLILIFSAIALVFLGAVNPTFLTGYVVFETDNGTASYEDLINYDNISLGLITQEIALNAILQAEKDMLEMQEEGFGIVWVNDTLIEAKKHFEGENYTALLEEIGKIEDEGRREKSKQLLIAAQQVIGVEVDFEKVLEKAKAINERKQEAFELNDLIRASELRIQEFRQLGLDVEEASLILKSAELEFENERYENVESILSSVDKKLIELGAETTIVRTIYKAGRENIGTFFKVNYKVLLLFLGSLLVIFILLYNRVKIAFLRRDIRDMKVEKQILEELMKKAQSDYYTKGDITKQTFKIKMEKFKESLVKIKQKLPVAEDLLDKRLKSKRVI